jgi:cardiolipin synthase A/B
VFSGKSRRNIGVAEIISGFRGLLSDDVLQRVTGSPLVSGNRINILRDGRENYPEWEAAIAAARDRIHIEMYVVHNDRTGRRFRDLLVAKAREGVKVRVLYDWLGSLSPLKRRLWAPLIEAGGNVRAANPPRLNTLLGWISRDHRKLLVIDGAVAFISGLCVGDAWMGDKTRRVAPWRDTGVAIHGPSVAYAEAAFSASWRLTGSPIESREPQSSFEIVSEGDTPLRIVATTPDVAGLYRLDLLAAATAKEYLWLADAYFLGNSPYIQALRSAAEDGVDVRLLVPQGSDLQWIGNVSRTMYRSLLESGVRVFEWNGPMMHAKTAVCDDRLVRIGSTNLNISSWIGNWELDVVIEDKGPAEEMREFYKEDLANSTEIVITGRNKVRPVKPLSPRGRRPTISSGGKSVLAGVVKVSSTVNDVVTGRRGLSRTEAASLLSIGAFFFLSAVVILVLPKLLAYPLGVMFGWAGIFFLAKSLQLRFGGKRGKKNGRRKR